MLVANYHYRPKRSSATNDGVPPVPPLPPVKRRCPRSHLPAPLNDSGQTELHLLCQDPETSEDAVRDCLTKYPDAAQISDIYDRTPVFYALKRECSLPVVDMVFQAYPAGLTRTDVCRASGIHMLYHPSKDPAFLAAVLKHLPSLSLYKNKSFAARPLLDLFCDAWKNLDVTPACTNDKAWTKLVLTVQAAHKTRFPDASDDKLLAPELHMALELKLRPTVVCHFARLYPEQASLFMTRCQNLLPLHLLVSQPFTTGCDLLVRDLITAFPVAAATTTVSSHGSYYPLHKALANNFGWSTGLKDIAFAFPDALQVIDPDTRLSPFMTAAPMDTSDLNTVYSLLRERPLL